MVDKIDISELPRLSRSDLRVQFPLQMAPAPDAVASPNPSGTQPDAVWIVDPARPDGLRKTIITGRKSISKWKKLNPLWWFGNADDPTPPPAYLQGWPEFLRRFIFVYVRNIGDNFKNYIVGVEEQNYYVVTDQEPYDSTTWQDVPQGHPNYGRTGYKTHTIYLASGAKRGFRSYYGKRVLWYLGWNVGGNWGLKFAFVKSPVQFW